MKRVGSKRVIVSITIYMINLTKERVVELRNQGMTYQAIANKAGVSRQRIAQIINPECQREYRRHVYHKKIAEMFKDCNLYKEIK